MDGIARRWLGLTVAAVAIALAIAVGLTVDGASVEERQGTGDMNEVWGPHCLLDELRCLWRGALWSKGNPYRLFPGFFTVWETVILGFRPGSRSLTNRSAADL